MAIITEENALLILPLATMKDELRIPVDITEHDDLLTSQITDAVSFVSKSTGRGVADLAALRPAIVSACRALYNGEHEIAQDAAHYGWLDPFRSYKAG